MANSITAGNSSNGGTAIVTDTSGTLNIVTGSGSGSTAISVDASQSTTFNSAASTAPFIVKINGTESARIDSSGNLLVNMTSPINAFNQLNVQSSNAKNGVGITTSSNTGTTYFSAFYASTTLIGYISTSTYTSVVYATSSDYRLKENIQPMTGALATVAQLKPVTYKWKSTGGDGQGFIAHELQSVVPESVVGEKDAVDAEGNPVYQGIDTSFLVATLTAAIQEQQAMILELKAELDAVKAKVGV